MAIVFGEVEDRGLAGEESQVDSSLLCGRRMPAKDRVIFRAPWLIQDLPRGDGVCCLGCSEQGNARYKYATVEMHARLRLWRIGKRLLLCVRDRREKKAQQQNKNTDNTRTICFFAGSGLVVSA